MTSPLPVVDPPGRRHRRRTVTAFAVVLLVGGVLAIAVGATRRESSQAATSAPVPAANARTTTFDDEFDGPAGSAVDPTRWVNQVGGAWNYGRDEQYYTPGAHNAALTGRGTLLISARTEVYRGTEGSRAYTSARLMSTSAVLHGHVEARIRMQNMQGSFPAFWLLGSNYADVGWPACGEIDVMETANVKNRISGGLHGPQEAARRYYWTGGNYVAPTAAWLTEWHVYSIDWTATSVVWSVDGTPFADVDRTALAPGQAWAVDQPANIVLNVAVGGYAGTPGPGFAAQMEIDWVRVVR